MHCPYVENYIDMDAAWILSIGGVEPRWGTRPSKSLTNMLHLDATLTVRSVCPVIILCVRLSGAQQESRGNSCLSTWVTFRLSRWNSAPRRVSCDHAVRA